MEWWTHARTVHSYTEVEEYQPITQSHTTRREREENHSHSLLPPTFSLISLSLSTNSNIRNFILRKPSHAPAHKHTRTHTVSRTEKSILIMGPAVLGPSLHCDAECEVIHDRKRFPTPTPHRTTNPSLFLTLLFLVHALSLPLSLVLSHRVQGDENDTAQKGSLCKLDQRSHAHPASPSSFANPCVMDKTTWPELVGWKEVLNAD